ncbi:MAG: hypothetical protein K5819_08550 [Lachnospiraceae bacterium]|nr:hypothetical protein [Lachnospiraceae bacterium]
MKKNIYIIGCILFIAFIAFTGYQYHLSQQPDDDSYLKKQLQYLGKDHDVKVLWYGKNATFPKRFPLSRISSLESKNWEKNNDYVFLFVNDLNGKTLFAKEDAIRIKKYADTHNNFYFYYLGKDKLHIFEEIDDECSFNKEDMSFGYEMYEGDRVQSYGLWDRTTQEATEDCPENFQEIIIDAVERAVKSNE